LTGSEPYFSTAHGQEWVNIYVDDLAKGSDLASAGQYTECAKIVKVHFTGASGTEVRWLMLMVKMPVGFDPDNGDWWYGYYDASVGTSVIEQGIIVNCIHCHEQASGTDYIFSKEVIEKSTR